MIALVGLALAIGVSLSAGLLLLPGAGKASPTSVTVASTSASASTSGMAASVAPAPISETLTSPGKQVVMMRRIDNVNGWAWVDDSGADALAGYYRLMLTNDAGKTWRDATPSTDILLVSTWSSGPQIDFVDADHGWVLDAADGSLWRTADGGRTWHYLALPSGRTAQSAAMTFISASTGYLLLGSDGSGGDPWVLYRTDDAGASLHRVAAVELPGQSTYIYTPGIAFSNRYNGIVADWKGALVTHDGGLTWSSASLPLTADTTPPYMGAGELHARGQQVILLAAISDLVDAPGPVALLSDDTGDSWGQVWPDTTQIQAVWAIVDEKTWLVFDRASAAIRVTTDAGQAGNSTAFSRAWPGGRRIIAASFVSATEGWGLFQIDPGCPASPSCPSPARVGLLAETHDGGLSWAVARQP